jgi:hypothetical protein
MSRHLHLFSSYDSIRLAQFLSASAVAPEHREKSGTEPAAELADSASPQVFNMSWMHTYPATQKRFARIGGIHSLTAFP